MSTIKCPNCHCNLPEGASFCGNCGSEITICPLCEKALPSGSSFCNFCGFEINTDQDYDQDYNNGYDEDYEQDYRSSHNHSQNYNQSYNQNYSSTNYTSNGDFSPRSTSSPDQEPNVETAKKLFLDWEKGSFFNKFLFTKDLWFLGVLATILYAATYFILKKYVKDSPIAMLENYESTISTIKTLLFTALSLTVINRTYNNLNEVVCFYSFSKWCSKHNYSFQTVIQNTLEMDFNSLYTLKVRNHLEYVDLCVCCELYDKKTSFKIKTTLIKLIKAIVDVASSIFIVCLVYEFIGLFMLAVISDGALVENTTFFADYIENYLLFYVLGARIVIDIVCSIAYKTIIKQEKKNWLNANFPNYMPKYLKYKK